MSLPLSDYSSGDETLLEDHCCGFISLLVLCSKHGISVDEIPNLNLRFIMACSELPTQMERRPTITEADLIYGYYEDKLENLNRLEALNMKNIFLLLSNET